MTFRVVLIRPSYRRANNSEDRLRSSISGTMSTRKIQPSESAPKNDNNFTTFDSWDHDMDMHLGPSEDDVSMSTTDGQDGRMFGIKDPIESQPLVRTTSTSVGHTGVIGQQNIGANPRHFIG